MSIKAQEDGKKESLKKLEEFISHTKDVREWKRGEAVRLRLEGFSYREIEARLSELRELGFKIELVLADSLYGEASLFIETLDQYKLPWVLAIRNNHGVWMPDNQTVRANKWGEFERIFSNQKSETR